MELISVPRNRETGRARGFAFVDMATREELEKAIEGINGIMYGGRTLIAAESLPKDQVPKKADIGTCFSEYFFLLSCADVQSSAN